MGVRAAEDDSQRHPLAVGHDAALAAVFPPVRRVPADRFQRQRRFHHRPVQALPSSQCLPARRTPASCCATTPGKGPPPPIPGSNSAPYYRCRTRFWGPLSKGSQSAARRGCPQTLSGALAVSSRPLASADRRPRYPFVFGVSRSRPAPKIHLTAPNWLFFSSACTQNQQSVSLLFHSIMFY